MNCVVTYYMDDGERIETTEEGVSVLDVQLDLARQIEEANYILIGLPTGARLVILCKHIAYVLVEAGEK